MPKEKKKVYLSASDHHRIILNKMKSCDSYTEFGICQGHSLAAVMLTNPKKIRAYDINLDWYIPAKHLFDGYADNHQIDFDIFETDTSTCPVIDKTDMLHIDSKHTFLHCNAELNLHANQVQKFIVFHDTNESGIWRAVTEYVNCNKEWSIIERETAGVGCTVIERRMI